LGKNKTKHGDSKKGRLLPVVEEERGMEQVKERIFRAV
jgi:hypothetical protein